MRWLLNPGVIFVLVAVGTAWNRVQVGEPAAAVKPPPAQRQVSIESCRPKWQIGDQWVIETVTRVTQARSGKADDAKAGPPVRWRFRVAAVEKLAGTRCYRIEIRCLLAGRQQPSATIWVDKKSLALRQVRAQVPVPGGFRTVTESYKFRSGQASPVVAPLTALPLDLPRFLTPNVKGGQKFAFQAVSGPAGTKAVDEISFDISVEQRVSSPSPLTLKKLVDARFAKELETSPPVYVELKAFDRRVEQVWKEGAPWALYSTNGPTTSRLVEVSPRGRNR